MGIGIGIGIVFGIILMIVFIAFFFGWVINTNSKESTPTGYTIYTPTIQPPIAQQIQKITEETGQEIKKAQEELVGKETANKDDLFKNSKARNTQNGITLSLDDFTVEDKGDWGKITKIKVTILNEGSTTLTPYVNVMLWDDNSKREDRYSTKATLKSDGWIDNGNYKVLEAPVSIAFRDLELEKTMKLSLVEGVWDVKVLVAVEHRFKIRE